MYLITVDAYSKWPEVIEMPTTTAAKTITELRHLLASLGLLENFLLTYRTTPHSSTGVTPASLFLGRSLRTRLDLMRPELEKIVSDKQAVQKRQHDQHARRRVLHIGQHIIVKNLRPEPPWSYNQTSWSCVLSDQTD